MSNKRRIYESRNIKKIRPYITKVRRKFQQDQTLVISVDVENKDFAVIVTEEAYKLGAKEVVLNWRCSPIARQRLLHANESVLEKPANWIPEFYKQYIDDKAAFLSLN